MLRLAATAMRTRFEVVLTDEERTEPELRAAGEEVLEEIQQVEQWLSVYRDDAVLFAINAAAGETPIRVSAPILSFLLLARGVSIATDFAFDLTVGPLVRLWRECGGAGIIPSAEVIAERQALVGIDKVVIDNKASTVYLPHAGMRFDPGAIGKGYALDRAAELLRENGICSALLHGGSSSVVAIGEISYPIALQHPLRPELHLATVNLKDEALGVSAVHGQTFYADRRVFGHIIDPRTGYPVEKTVLAACTSISATLADALSTTLLVLGREGIFLLARKFPECGFLVVTVEEKNITVTTAGSHSFTITDKTCNQTHTGQ